MFFAVLAVTGQIERNHMREKTLESQVIAAAKGNHGGRPKAIDDDMLTFAVALKDRGVPVRDIAKRLTIKTGKNAGESQSIASLSSPKPGRPLRPTTCRPGPSAGCGWPRPGSRPRGRPSSALVLIAEQQGVEAPAHTHRLVHSAYCQQGSGDVGIRVGAGVVTHHMTRTADVFWCAVSCTTRPPHPSNGGTPRPIWPTDGNRGRRRSCGREANHGFGREPPWGADRGAVRPLEPARGAILRVIASSCHQN